jgi:hemoglobin
MPEHVSPEPRTRVSYFERLGGEPSLRAIVDDFVDRAFDDIMIGFLFQNADRARVKQFEYQHASEFLGGPDRYVGRPLRQAHAAHPIMGGHFSRRLQLLRNVFAAHAVPADIADAWLAHNLALRDEITGQDPAECRD